MQVIAFVKRSRRLIKKVLERDTLPHNKKVPENRPITARRRVENAANHEREAVSNECDARGVSQSVQEAQKPDTNIKTTEIYARADSAAKREALEKASPIKDIVQFPSWSTDAGLMEWLQGFGRKT